MCRCVRNDPAACAYHPRRPLAEADRNGAAITGQNCEAVFGIGHETDFANDDCDTSGTASRRSGPAVTGGAFPRKVGGENRTVTAGRRPWWPRMAGLQPLSTRAFGPRLRRLTALTALATRPLIATKRSTARCGQSVCKCHAEKFRSAIFARILTAVHTCTLCPKIGARCARSGEVRRHTCIRSHVVYQATGRVIRYPRTGLLQPLSKGHAQFFHIVGAP